VHTNLARNLQDFVQQLKTRRKSPDYKSGEHVSGLQESAPNFRLSEDFLLFASRPGAFQLSSAVSTVSTRGPRNSGASIKAVMTSAGSEN
jgi:adenine C2-methylase RlmN of 23S rRNA A2503 and tRNA A37